MHEGDDHFAEDGRNAPDSGTLAGLNARVAKLERVVAELHAAAAGQGPEATEKAVLLHPRPRTSIPGAASAPPPPLPPLPLVPAPLVPAQLRAAAEPSDEPVARRMSFSGLDTSLKQTASLESRLGSQVFNLVGMVALIAGAAWALKLAVEHGYIGPVARVLIGLAAGVALVLWSERFRSKGFPAFSSSLKAVGTAVLYLSLWAALQLYHLLPPSVALLAMILVTAWNAFMAWSQDAELLAAYALLGGFATPLLLSTGGDHEGFLFTYLGAIGLAIVALLHWKPWRRLLLPVFLATVAFFIGWYAQWYRFANGNGPFAETLLFAGMFGAIFALPSLRGWMSADSGPGGFGDTIVPVLLPLGNAVFVGCAIYSVLEDSGRHGWLAWAAVALAAVYLGLMRVQRTSVASAMHLAIAVVFLTIAIPLKASGHTLTTAWLVEGLALFWVSTRFGETQRQAAGLLRGLSAAGFGLGLCSLMAHWWWFGAESAAFPFLNRNLAASLVAFVTLGGAVWIAKEQAAAKLAAEPSSVQLLAQGIVATRAGHYQTAALAALLGIDLVAVLLSTAELGESFSFYVAHRAFANVPFWTACVGLVALAGSASVALLLERSGREHFRGSAHLAGISAVVFNLLTILCIEREIGALWHRSNANLQRSLANSGFLMLYGVVLLAIGFSRRSAFTRWQALLLLLFTVCKVFLYDTLGLSAGYRVTSFMALGAVLMAVSFAYQKDWLHLKDNADEKNIGPVHAASPDFGGGES